MVSALASGIEKLRLSTLHRYGILDTDREDAFDDLAKLAATACGTPAAWIAFVNGDRLWFKSTFGFERREIPRAHALCEDALTHPDVFVVRDTLSDASYADSPLVRGAPRARFYAAAPLVTPDGYALGAIAVAGHAPRELEPAQADALRALARQIVTLLEARLAETLNRRALELSSDIIYMTDDGGHFTFVNPVATRILGYERDELLGKHYLELIRPDFREAVAEFYSKQSELRETSTYFEFPAVAKGGTEVWFGQNVQIVTDGRKVTGFHAVARDITARRQAQDALRRSEERLRQALLSTNGGIWEYCLGSQKFTWSDDFYRLLGMEPGEREPSVESWLERVHPDDRAWVRETAATSLGESGELDIEYRVVLAGGRVRWLNVKGKAVRNGTAGAARYAGIAIDITARKTAEEEARRASEYANLFRYANDAILVLDPETGRILDANEKACESYGHDLHGLVGASLDAISTSPVEELRLFAEHAPRGESFEFEADHRADGRVIHLLVSASFIDYHGGRALLCICRDITARKEAEERLRVSEARYRQLIEQASDGIVLFTTDGTILESNDRICEITGRACDELVGSNVTDYLKREDLVAEPIRYRELLSGDTLLTNRRVVRADGTLVPVEITARVLTGEKKVILAIVRDVTERRRAEEMLRRSEEQLFKAQRMEAIGQLAGGVAHDFNNILTGVFGFTDLALRQVEALEAGGKTEATGRLRQNLEEVKDAGQRGAGLTKQLLAFSRQQQLAQRTIDINQTITSLLGLLRRLIEENVTMHFYPGADRSTVSADAGQIEQVLLNLAANARDAMPTGGQLIIETANVTLDDAYVERHPYARAGRYLLIRVSDTGTGMQEHVRSRIFEPFFTTKDVDKGTGLGLSTAYGIVKQHNGTVEVYSEPGHGTTFKIYLPLESGPAEKVVEPERPRLVGGAETVLVVEDDPSLERLARQYLEELGYRVVCAQNGRDAVKVYEARHRDIDLILLDVIMPGLDGPEALREMRELVPDTAPVVFMTGYSPEVVRARLEEELNAGAGLLPKPYTLAEIGAKVREALDARRGGGREGGG